MGRKKKDSNDFKTRFRTTISMGETDILLYAFMDSKTNASSYVRYLIEEDMLRRGIPTQINQVSEEEVNKLFKHYKKLGKIEKGRRSIRRSPKTILPSELINKNLNNDREDEVALETEEIINEDIDTNINEDIDEEDNSKSENILKEDLSENKTVDYEYKSRISEFKRKRKTQSKNSEAKAEDLVTPKKTNSKTEKLKTLNL